MKNSLLAIVATFALVLTNAHAAIEEHYEEKPIKVQAGKQVQIRVGDKITFKIKVNPSEFFGQSTISANANIDNTTKQKVKAIYSISFHDKDGKLVGCHQGSWDLDPNKDVNYGSAIIFADAKSIASVSSYKLKTQVIVSTKD